MDLLLSLVRDFKINSTFFIMLGMFLATFIVLYPIAIRRLCSELVERDHRIAGRREESEKLKQENSEVQEKLAKEMAAAKAEAARTFGELRSKAQVEQRQILNAARERAAEKIQVASRAVQESLVSERSKLKGEVSNLSKELLNRIQKSPSLKSGRASAVESGV